jgi:hypothetical protein
LISKIKGLKIGGFEQSQRTALRNRNITLMTISAVLRVHNQVIQDIKDLVLVYNQGSQNCEKFN